MAAICKYLDLSTGNISEQDNTALTDAANGIDFTAEDSLPRVIDHTYGYWMHVPSAEDHAEDDAARRKSYPTIQGIIEYARKHDCNWVNIDQDAAADPDLPTFEW